jgi:hypothetical protein
MVARPKAVAPEEVAVAQDIDPNSVPIDTMADRVRALIKARQDKKAADAAEKDAKADLLEAMGDKTLGLVDGLPVLEITEGKRDNPPAYSTHSMVAADAAGRTTALLGMLMTDVLAITDADTFAKHRETLARAINKAVADVLEDHSSHTKFPVFGTDRFIRKS